MKRKITTLAEMLEAYKPSPKTAEGIAELKANREELKDYAQRDVAEAISSIIVCMVVYGFKTIDEVVAFSEPEVEIPE